MRALVWDGARLELRPDHPRPALPEGWARLRLRCAGICSTDQQILQGYMGFRGVPGHELVAEVSEGPAAWLGRRVTVEINFACGACPACARGLGRHCPRRTVLGILGQDGAFAEELVAPLANLHAVPDHVPDEEAVFTEPLAAAFEVLEQVHVPPGSRALVLGDGKLGQLCARVLALSGARVRLAGRHADKLALAAAAGLETALAAELEPAPEWDLVVEATGSPAGLRQAMELVRPRGTLVLKSTVAADHALSLAPLVINEVTVIGSRCGPFAPALRALAEGRVPSLGCLVHGDFPLEQGAAAFARAREPGTLKVLLRP
ncbi:MAG: alcohol dehydrogenase catalytic domain-containing protein [Planctomycetota bacterium]